MALKWANMHVNLYHSICVLVLRRCKHPIETVLGPVWETFSVLQPPASAFWLQKRDPTCVCTGVCVLYTHSSVAGRRISYYVVILSYDNYYTNLRDYGNFLVSDLL